MDNDKYNCLVVDDEPIARKIIINYLTEMPSLQLCGECINAMDAIEHLRKHPEPDIIYLDINMPNLSGLQLLKIIQPHQPVIFTTAYSEFAVESYDLNAVDYLLKPFSFERFTKASYKAIAALKNAGKESHQTAKDKSPVVFIKSDGKNYPVQLDDILYCEAMKNYTLVKLKDNQKLMPLIPLSKFEMFLKSAGGDFIQIHRSFLISKKHITAVTSSVVNINTYEIPIGVQFRENFFKAIGMKNGL